MPCASRVLARFRGCWEVRAKGALVIADADPVPGPRRRSNKLRRGSNSRARLASGVLFRIFNRDNDLSHLCRVRMSTVRSVRYPRRLPPTPEESLASHNPHEVPLSPWRHYASCGTDWCAMHRLPYRML